MSYRTEEKKIQWKLRRIKAIVIAVILLIVVSVCIFSAFVPPETWPYYFYLPVVAARQEGELRMHFIDVGQGDCTLIELPDGKTMMIDGGNGEKENTTTIMRYLKALNLSRLDYLVLTHVDSDHCGGLDVVMSQVEVGCVYYPSEQNFTVNSEFAEFSTKLSELSCKKEHNRRSLTLTSENTDYPYEISWLWPYGEDNPNASQWEDNEKSAIILLEYAGKKALFAGDAPASVLDLLYLHSSVGLLPGGKKVNNLDVYKVPHHGSEDGISSNFLAYASPKQAIVSCGLNNAYGHPHGQTLTELGKVGATVYRTDEKGNILSTWKKDGTQEIKTDEE